MCTHYHPCQCHSRRRFAGTVFRKAMLAVVYVYPGKNGESEAKSEVQAFTGISGNGRQREKPPSKTLSSNGESCDTRERFFPTPVFFRSI